MKYVTGVMVFAAAVLAAQLASAQETSQGAGRIEVTAFPGGTFFTQGSKSRGGPDFANYALGASLTYNINQHWGVEGEVGGAFGAKQRLTFQGQSTRVAPPNTLAYNGNVLFYPWRNDRKWVPYATGGAGGLTMFERASVGVRDRTTFFTGNAGGGLKYYLGNRWALRGDYRFFAVKSKHSAPEFFGRDTRYGHRVYGGIVFDLHR